MAFFSQSPGGGTIVKVSTFFGEAFSSQETRTTAKQRPTKRVVYLVRDIIDNNLSVERTKLYMSTVFSEIGRLWN